VIKGAVESTESANPLNATPLQSAGPSRVIPRRDRWETCYAVGTIAADLLAIAIVVVLGYMLGLGTYVPQLGEVSPGVGIVAGGLMLFALLCFRAWDPRVIHDPRVTRVGAVMRRYSLDELPQLLNVLAGRMSLVGPRPPLPSEVATYGRDAQRKLMVKPGLTGRWQVIPVGAGLVNPAKPPFLGL
jgi:hypothetical protein